MVMPYSTTTSPLTHLTSREPISVSVVDLGVAPWSLKPAS